VDLYLLASESLRLVVLHDEEITHLGRVTGHEHHICHLVSAPNDVRIKRPASH
jgi:hypothetical protein